MLELTEVLDPMQDEGRESSMESRKDVGRSVRIRPNNSNVGAPTMLYLSFSTATAPIAFSLLIQTQAGNNPIDNPSLLTQEACNSAYESISGKRL
jgi:hypothetical protein